MYKLSKTAKMPGKSFALPTTTCKVGSKLCKVKGSVCASCYARKGYYQCPSVKSVRENNFDQWTSQIGTNNFRAELKTLIEAEYLKTGVPYFRWFDSGDLQSEKMLYDIIWIAMSLPKVKFWLPTKELSILTNVMAELEVNNMKLPSNLNIRLSAYQIDGGYFHLPLIMSDVAQTRVISSSDKSIPREMVCPTSCEDCGYKCWNSMVSVAYVKH